MLRISHEFQLHEVSPMIGGLALLGAATIAWATGPGGGDPSCFEDTNQSACEFYQDLTPECRDIFHGGGTCGVQVATSGLSMTMPANAECTVTQRTENEVGECIVAYQGPVGVGCSVAAGQPCG
jgi:hypothetical protein